MKLILFIFAFSFSCCVFSNILVVSEVNIEEKFENIIPEPTRYIVGYIKILENKTSEYSVHFDFIRFFLNEKYQRVAAIPGSYSTASGEIKSVRFTEKNEFSFLIETADNDKIICTGVPNKQNSNEYRIEAHGVIENYTGKTYSFSWHHLPEVKLPKWKICYSNCLDIAFKRLMKEEE